MASERMVVARRLVASGLSAAVSGLILKTFGIHRHQLDWREATLAALLAGPPTVAAVLVWSRRTGAQLLARACWWCFLIVGVMTTVIVGGGGDRWQPVFDVVCTGLALLAIGRTGLGESGGFRPVAFRGTLQLSLVLAMADTASLGLFGLCCLLGPLKEALPMLALASATGLGVVGLLRLRTWGLLVAFVSNLLVGTLAATGILPAPYPLRLLLVATASLQLVVPLPMLVTIVRRRAPPPDRWNRFRAVGATAAIVGLMALGVYAGVVSDTPLVHYRPFGD